VAMEVMANASANGQSLVTAADYAAMRTLLGLVIGTNVQAYNAVLTTLAGASADGQALVTAANYAAMRTLLGLVIGTNVQAYNAVLTTLAGASANGQSLVTAADYAAMRALLGLGTAALVSKNKATVTIPVYNDYNNQITWASMLAAVRFLGAATVGRAVFPQDLTDMTEVRIQVLTGTTAGASGAKVSVKYYTSGSNTVADYLNIGASDVAATIDVASTWTTSGWQALTAGAIGDRFIAVTGEGGNGSISPTIQKVVVQFR